MFNTHLRSQIRNALTSSTLKWRPSFTPIVFRQFSTEKQQQFINRFGESKQSLMNKWFDLNTEAEIEAEFSRLRMDELATEYKIDLKVKGIQRLSSIVNRYEKEQASATQNKDQQLQFGERIKQARERELKKQQKQKQSKENQLNMPQVAQSIGIVSKAQQQDIWLCASNEELIVECQLYGLAVSERHLDNVQSLLSYLDKQQENTDKGGKASPMPKARAMGKNDAIEKKEKGIYGYMENEGEELVVNEKTIRSYRGEAMESVDSQLQRIFSSKKSSAIFRDNEEVEGDMKMTKDKALFSPDKSQRLKAGIIKDFDRHTFSLDELINSPSWQKASKQKPRVIKEADVDLSDIRPSLQMSSNSNPTQDFEYLFKQLTMLSPANFFDKAGSAKSFNALNPGQQQTVLNQMTGLRSQLSGPDQLIMKAQSDNLDWKYITSNNIWTRINQESKDKIVHGLHQYFEGGQFSDKQSIHTSKKLIDLICRKDFPQKEAQALGLKYLLTNDFLRNIVAVDKLKFNRYFEWGFEKTKANVNEKELADLIWADMISIGRIVTNLKSKFGLEALPSICEFQESPELARLMEISTKVSENQAISTYNPQQKYELLSLFPDSDVVKQPIIYASILESICSELHLSKSDLSFKQIVEVIERSLKLSNNRVLQNQVRKGVTDFVKSSNFNQMDTQILKLLKLMGSEWDSGAQKLVLTKGRLEKNMFEAILAWTGRGSQPFYDIQSQKQLRTFMDILDLQYRYNPLNLYNNFLLEETLKRDTIQSIAVMADQKQLHLEDMVRFSKLINPSIAQPDLLFKDMCSSQQSFRDDVSPIHLEEFTDALLGRIHQFKVSFSHLKSSKSLLHTKWVPHKVDTMNLFRKVIEDLIPEASQKDMGVINKIFSAIPLRLFANQKEADVTLEQYFEKVIENNQYESVEKVTQQLNAVTAVRPLMSSNLDLYHLANTALQASVEGALNFVKDKGDSLRLDQVLKLNAGLLEAISQTGHAELSKSMLTSVNNQPIFQEVIGGILNYNYGDKEMHKDSVYRQTIEQLSRQDLERQVGPLLSHFNVQASVGQLVHWPEDLDLMGIFLNDIKSSRSLTSGDLRNLFEVLPHLQRTASNSSFDKLILNISNNINTIGVDMIYQRTESGQEEAQLDPNFQQSNKVLKDKNHAIKMNIIDTYISIQRDQDRQKVFQYTGDQPTTLAPLSEIISQVFDKLDHNQILDCLKVLGNENFDNYDKKLIQKLFRKYVSTQTMEQLYDSNSKFFFEFAKAWPMFLTNNSLLNQLTRIKNWQNTSVVAEDQCETLSILMKKNVLSPELLDVHFQTFIRMRDKDTVQAYLTQYLQSCAYFGYAEEHTNMQQLTQVFRRLYKVPQDVPYTQLVDYMIVLACSGQYYKGFDDKSVAFIEKALDLIEKRSVGTESIQADRKSKVQVKFSNKQTDQLTKILDPSSESADKINLQYFKQIHSPQKTYNKTQILTEHQTKEYKALIKSTEDAAGLDLLDEESSGESDASDSDLDVEAAVVEKSSKRKGEDLDLNPEDISGEDSDQEEVMPAKAQKKEWKSYERKGDRDYNMDAEYESFKKRKIQQLDKRGKHILVFSGVNRLAYEQLNDIEACKAWVILYHFRAKSIQSMLYEEFSAIAKRNCIGKSKSNALLTKLNSALLVQSFEHGFHVRNSQVCEQTGWPIDFSIKKKDTIMPNQKQKEVKAKTNDLSLYFLIKEEVCFNAKTQKEEPLALQKLMIRHLSTIGKSKVVAINESDVIDDYEGTLQKVMSQIMSNGSDKKREKKARM